MANLNQPARWFDVGIEEHSPVALVLSLYIRALLALFNRKNQLRKLPMLFPSIFAVSGYFVRSLTEWRRDLVLCHILYAIWHRSGSLTWFEGSRQIFHRGKKGGKNIVLSFENLDVSTFVIFVKFCKNELKNISMRSLRTLWRERKENQFRDTF